MNKLDTHLTNLKSYINSELNLNLNISTIKGRLTQFNKICLLPAWLGSDTTPLFSNVSIILAALL